MCEKAELAEFPMVYTSECTPGRRPRYGDLWAGLRRTCKTDEAMCSAFCRSGISIIVMLLMLLLS